MSVVRLYITHSASQKRVPEKRFGLTQTTGEIKQAMYGHFGVMPDECRLDLYNEIDALVETDMKSDKMLGYYQCRDDFRIHCVDLRAKPRIEDYDDVSKVEKYVMSDENWLRRENNMRTIIAKMKEQQRREAEAAGIELPPELHADSYKEEAAKISVGDRCKCLPGDRLASVQFVGRLAALKPGYWVGVKFDEPVGKGDGSVKGQRVFQCLPNYGGFLRPDQVEAGDFPEEDLFAELEGD